MSTTRWTKAFQALFKQRRAARDTVKLVGQDHLGNKYFEALRPNNTRPVQRYFNRPKVESFEDVVDAAHVPPPWDAWLRFRRQEPPSDKEVQESEEYFQMQQAMATQKKMQAQVENMDHEMKQPDKISKAKPKARKIPPDQYGL